MKTVNLHPERDSSLKRRHPWIFSGAIRSVEGTPEPGETVLIVDAKGKPLASAAWSPASQIRARVWSFKPGQRIDTDFFRERLEAAAERRNLAGLNTGERSAYRLVYSESDGLPGLIVDRYADVLVCQFLSAGAEFWRTTLLDLLQSLWPGYTIYERSDVDVRSREGLSSRSGLVCGREPPERITMEEEGLNYLVDVRQGHKTGFYLDQREARAWVQQQASGRDVLNCFAYTGAFTVAALAGGAQSVVNVDSSTPSLALIPEHLQANGLDTGAAEQVTANVFEQLRAWRRDQRRFDLIILDPPKLIDSKQSQTRGARAYKDVNMQAFALLRPGGLLVTFSCSGLLAPALMQKIVADAALDAGVRGSVIHRLGQSADHPVALAFPEAEYLKGLCVQVD